MAQLNLDWLTRKAVLFCTEQEIKLCQLLFFKVTMARNCYQLIFRFLYFVDNHSRTAIRTDKLYKILPLYNFLRKIWKDLYSPGERISIDEEAGCHAGFTMITIKILHQKLYTVWFSYWLFLVPWCLCYGWYGIETNGSQQVAFSLHE